MKNQHGMAATRMSHNDTNPQGSSILLGLSPMGGTLPEARLV